MKPISTVLSLVSAVFVCLAAAGGCSKSNDVDISEGDLPAGAACTSGPDDPCAGACFQGTCRSHCGSNRECPVGQSCFGDGANAVCAPANSLEFDLLTDCADGCEVDLLPFAREGYFRLCELGESFVWEMRAAEATRDSLDPRELCSRTVGNAIAVKNEVFYPLDLHSDRTTCLEPGRAIGVLDDTLVSHDCTQNKAGEDVSSTCFGRLIEAGGTTYLVMDPLCTPPYYADDDTYYQLFEFSAEAVDLPCDEAGPATCDNPTFPPVGEAVSGFDGFWVRCDNESRDNLCIEPTPDTATTASENCQHISYETFRNSGFSEYDAVYVRPDGFGMRIEGWPEAYYDSCNFAFRESSDGRVAVAGRAHAPVGGLEVEYETWQLIDTDGGETLLWRSDPYICGNPAAGNYYRNVEVPDDFDDRCEWGLPEFTF